MTQPENDFPAGLSAPARRALDGAGYVRLEQLTRVSESELKKLHGKGPKAINLLWKRRIYRLPRKKSKKG